MAHCGCGYINNTTVFYYETSLDHTYVSSSLHFVVFDDCVLFEVWFHSIHLTTSIYLTGKKYREKGKQKELDSECFSINQKICHVAKQYALKNGEVQTKLI